jgi:hypothetical protein
VLRPVLFRAGSDQIGGCRISPGAPLAGLFSCSRGARDLNEGFRLPGARHRSSLVAATVIGNGDGLAVQVADYGNSSDR